MQQYKRPEAIKRMNELAGSRKPFLFIIDYKQQCSLIEEISRIDSTRCRYNFNGVKNVDTVTESYSGPVSYTHLNEKERILKIHILPPFYLSGWAYFIYLLLGDVYKRQTFRRSRWMLVFRFKARPPYSRREFRF